MIIVKLFLQIKEEILQDFNMTPEDKKKLFADYFNSEHLTKNQLASKYPILAYFCILSSQIGKQIFLKKHVCQKLEYQIFIN